MSSFLITFLSFIFLSCSYHWRSFDFEKTPSSDLIFEALKEDLKSVDYQCSDLSNYNEIIEFPFSSSDKEGFLYFSQTGDQFGSALIVAPFVDYSAIRFDSVESFQDIKEASVYFLGRSNLEGKKEFLLVVSIDSGSGRRTCTYLSDLYALESGEFIITFNKRQPYFNLVTKDIDSVNVEDFQGLIQFSVRSESNDIKGQFSALIGITVKKP